MTTLTVDIPDEAAAYLSETARQMNITLEELAVQRLLQPMDSEEEIRELTRQIIEEDRELLERLA